MAAEDENVDQKGKRFMTFGRSLTQYDTVTRIRCHISQPITAGEMFIHGSVSCVSKALDSSFFSFIYSD